jgi:hypothetical protein
MENQDNNKPILNPYTGEVIGPVKSDGRVLTDRNKNEWLDILMEAGFPIVPQPEKVKPTSWQKFKAGVNWLRRWWS